MRRLKPKPSISELREILRERTREQLVDENYYHCLWCMDTGYQIERPVADLPEGRFNRNTVVLCHCQ